MIEQRRRVTDSVAHGDFSIGKLIAEEDDAKQRTFLLLLADMSKALNENTKLTRLIAERTETHMKEHDDWASQGKVWRLVGRGAWVLLLLASPFMYNAGSSWVQQTEGRLGTLELRAQKIEDVSRAVKLFEGRRE